MNMTEIEHSRMLYLMDSLKSAPKKSKLLFKMALDHKTSFDYKKSLLRLMSAAKHSETILLEEIIKLRKEML